MFIGAGLVFLNYLFMAEAYKRIDLSLAYPIGRSSTLFLPLVAFVMLGETVDLPGLGAIFLILSGVVLLHGDDLAEKGISAVFSSGSGFALAAAFTAAGYTVWDKSVLTFLHPIVYFYSYNCVIAAGYGCVLARCGKERVAREWETSGRAAILVGILNTLTYSMVLYALSFGKSVYVGGLRQFSLVVGLGLGWTFLGENMSPFRIAGVLVVISGSLLTLLGG